MVASNHGVTVGLLEPAVRATLANGKDPTSERVDLVERYARSGGVELVAPEQRTAVGVIRLNEGSGRKRSGGSPAGLRRDDPAAVRCDVARPGLPTESRRSWSRMLPQQRPCRGVVGTDNRRLGFGRIVPTTDEQPTMLQRHRVCPGEAAELIRQTSAPDEAS